MSLENLLLKRGIHPESLEEILRLLGPDEVVTSPDQVLDDSFRPRDAFETPFPKTRYGDGTIGIYYSAFAERTCKEEISFHLGSSVPMYASRY